MSGEQPAPFNRLIEASTLAVAGWGRGKSDRLGYRYAMAGQNARERSELSNEWSQVVRNEREKRGLTQQSIVDRSGLTRQTYLRLEYGHRVPDLTQVARIADALGMHASELVGMAEQRVVPDVDAPKRRALDSRRAALLGLRATSKVDAAAWAKHVAEVIALEEELSHLRGESPATARDGAAVSGRS